MPTSYTTSWDLTRPKYDVVHLNSEFADAIQASDHEPSVVRLKFGEEED